MRSRARYHHYYNNSPWKKEDSIITYFCPIFHKALSILPTAAKTHAKSAASKRSAVCYSILRRKPAFCKAGRSAAYSSGAATVANTALSSDAGSFSSMTAQTAGSGSP